MAIRATVGGGCEEPILEVLREWERLGVSPVAGAAWLQSLRLAVSRTSAPDFVWTGPEVAGLHARDTRRVYEELLGTAERSIWASTYAFFDGPQAFKILASRMDAVPGLEVTLLLNIERRRGDTTAADTLVRRFADEFRGPGVAGLGPSNGVLRPAIGGEGRPRGSAPCQGGGGGRGIGVCDVGEPYCGGLGPQHRARTSGAGPCIGHDNGDSLSNANRERPVTAIARDVAVDSSHRDRSFDLVRGGGPAPCQWCGRCRLAYLS